MVVYGIFYRVQRLLQLTLDKTSSNPLLSTHGSLNHVAGLRSCLYVRLLDISTKLFINSHHLNVFVYNRCESCLFKFIFIPCNRMLHYTLQ